MELPYVSVVIPCWNEARFVDAFLDSVKAQTYPADRMEILLIDAMSDDGTRAIVREHALREPNIRLLDNPGHSRPAALNRGIAEARGDVIVRLDVHAEYDPDYLLKCVQGLLRNPRADNVGGVRRSLPRDDTAVGRAIAVAATDMFGSGAARYRTGAGGPQWVDTVFGGCYRRTVFERIGVFDEQLSRAQDREFNQRLRAAGGKVLLLPDISSTYYARSDFREFCAWTFEAGYWPFRASRSVGRWIGSFRNVVPVGFVLTMAAGAAAAPRSRTARWATAGIAGLYGAVALASAGRLAWRHRDPALLVALPVVFVTTHVVYGIGSIWGALDPAARRG
ncbi:glycosyltransferase family 2 protein [Actinoplanes sp. L3-i22]|uniref:glycosyltransferase family 2 protein n=1 Tax=Actinoplanes sp. L3-i22 TaxID=2836373 RepID=UPI001C85CD7F|nr:glycosyltransferase family 2 protein [Actinoplanes sp. L3-i22]